MTASTRTPQTHVPIPPATAPPGPSATTGGGDDGGGDRDGDGAVGTRRYPSPVGELVLIAGPAGLAAVLWPDDDRPVRVGAGLDARTLLAAATASPTAEATAAAEVPLAAEARTAEKAPTGAAPADMSSVRRLLDEAARQLDEYFAGTRQVFELRLAPVGTAFQVAVWRSLAGIGYGETATYGQQAARIGRPTAVRAVGAATGRNPLSIVLPCHRVVGSDGRLTGFAGGLEAKAHLLDHEARHRRS